jgi:hypothetical protein
MYFMLFMEAASAVRRAISCAAAYRQLAKEFLKRRQPFGLPDPPAS